MTIALVIAGVFIGIALGIAVLMFRTPRLEPVTQWPAPDPLRQSTFASELTDIGVEAGPMPEPNYRTGEYPTVVVERVEAPPVEHVAQHAAAERALISEARPWLTPTLHTEPTPLFHDSGTYPVLDLDLSATGSWMAAGRTELLAWLARDEAEEAA